MSDRGLVEALIGQRKRWELEINCLEEELKSPDNEKKKKKKISELDSKISRINGEISRLQTTHRDIDY
jgi:chromosome segregation ATPase